MGIRIEREDDQVRVEVCDHDGTMEPLGGRPACPKNAPNADMTPSHSHAVPGGFDPNDP